MMSCMKINRSAYYNRDYGDYSCNPLHNCMDDGQNPAKQLEWEITISNELEVGDIHHINIFVG